MTPEEIQLKIDALNLSIEQKIMSGEQSISPTSVAFYSLKELLEAKKMLESDLRATGLVQHSIYFTND